MGLRTVRTAAKWVAVRKTGKFFDASGLMEFWILDRQMYKLCYALLPARERARLDEHYSYMRGGIAS